MLDGIGIDAAEQKEAHTKYSGKLTAEFLLEKIGHKYFEHIRELDLSSCRIREIERLSGKEFSNLTELNLNHNVVISLDGLHDLPSLTVLRLNNNKIRALDTTSASQAPQGDPNANAVSTTGGLMAIPNVEVLQLGFNKISDLRDLQLGWLRSLRVLFLQGNSISHLLGISCCVNLQELVLDKNHIKDLQASCEELSSLVKSA